MRYYVNFDQSGRLIGYMEYESANKTMKEVTKEEYAEILRSNGIPYDPAPEPTPAVSVEDVVKSMLGG